MQNIANLWTNSITLSGSKLVRSCDQLQASFEPDTVTEFGFHKLSFSTEMCPSFMRLCDIGTSTAVYSVVCQQLVPGLFAQNVLVTTQ